MDKRTYKDRKEYYNKYYREYYKIPKNKEKILEKSRKVSAQNRLIYNEWKKTLSCIKCGENHPACIEFHHINPEEKEYTISMLSGKTLKFILKEAAKCQILCANCHRKLHFSDCGVTET